VSTDAFLQLLTQPFTLGLLLGLIFAALMFYRYARLKLEMKRYKGHLSDKLEIEADTMRRLKQDLEKMRGENENLRIKVVAMREMPDSRAQRDLEIFARTEKRMALSAPGFVGAWESAKRAAIAEIEAEEAGRSMPKRIFTKLFGTTPSAEVKSETKLLDSGSAESK
jgi:hypothetical protein